MSEAVCNLRQEDDGGGEEDGDGHQEDGKLTPLDGTWRAPLPAPI